MMFIAEQQFSRYFVTFFSTKEEGNAMFGYMSTAQSAAEFFGMMLVPAIINRIGAKQDAPDRAGDQPAFDYLRVN